MYEYKIDHFESRDWMMRRRFGWRVKHRNGQIILFSNQAHSREIDRDTAAWNFYEKGLLQGGILPPDWAKRPTDALPSHS